VTNTFNFTPQSVI